MTFLLAALLFSTLPEPPKDHALRTDVLLLSAGATLDLAATEYRLQNCLSCREGNPAGPRLAHRLALKAATVTVGALVCRRLRKDGHGGAARVLGLLGLAGWGTVAVVNVTQ